MLKDLIDSLTVGDISTVILALSALIGGIVYLSRPFRSVARRLAKLEDAVFDKNGEPKLLTREEFDTMKKDISEIKRAVNLTCDAIMVLLDAQISGDHIEELKSAKTALHKERELI